MGCRLRELDGANVPHGLGVARGILPACHGLFSWWKKLVSEKKLASTPIAENPTWEYVTNILRSLDITKKIPQIMAPRARLCLGEGARCSVLLKFLRPSKTVAEAIVNPVKDQRLDDLIAVRREVTTRGGKSFVSIFYRSDTIPGVLHSAERWATVIEQGTGEIWGGEPDATATTADAAAPVTPNEQNESIADFIFNAQNRAEDIALVRAMGFEVDDDNEPAPENIPAPDAPLLEGGALREGQEWGWDGFDQRAQLGGAMYNGPSFADGWTPKRKTFLEIFLHLFPLEFFTNVIIEATSNALFAADSARTSLGEMLRYLGMWMLMSCYMKSPDYFWQSAARMAGDGVEDEENDIPSFTFNRYMSRRRFIAITSALRFTSSVPPTFRDKFWEVRDMIAAWNAHMAKIFVAAWVICLDESMSIWHNRWTCPGWVFCPRKPHPFGNEYHTACCGLSGILFSMELVEGKDHPPQIQERYSEHGKTTGLLMRMLTTYFTTGRYVVLDSGFCVLRALIELKKVGLFACAVIKKRRFWPAMVPGDEMTEHLSEANVGDAMSISGVLDGVKYFLWGLKEPQYVMKMMATGGPLIANETCKEQKRRFVEDGVEVSRTFKFPLPYDWHYKYRHAIDDHNNLRHSLPSIEGTIMTTRWELRVFSFLLAVSEVNAFLTYRFFCKPDKIPTLQEFRHKLAWQLIKNRWVMEQDEDEQQEVCAVHQLMKAPPHATKYARGRWVCTAKLRYQNYPCTFKNCGNPPKRVKTYCSCHIGKWICQYCHAAHVVKETKHD